MSAGYERQVLDAVGEVRLSAADLELVASGLRALAYAPGYDYGYIQAARALADRLAQTQRSESGVLVAAG